MMPLVSTAVDGTLRTIWLVALPRVWPPPATRLAVAPASRPTRFAVRVTDPPAPAVVWMVELPEAKTTPGVVGGSAAPKDSEEATPPPPRTFRLPPLKATTAASLTRLLLLTALLSSVSVPPGLSVTAALAAVAAETEPSMMFADADRPDVLIAITGWGNPARAPWNVT